MLLLALAVVLTALFAGGCDNDPHGNLAVTMHNGFGCAAAGDTCHWTSDTGYRCTAKLYGPDSHADIGLDHVACKAPVASSASAKPFADGPGVYS